MRHLPGVRPLPKTGRREAEGLRVLPSLAAHTPPCWALQGEAADMGTGLEGGYGQTEWRMKPFRWQMSLIEMR